MADDEQQKGFLLGKQTIDVLRRMISDYKRVMEQGDATGEGPVWPGGEPCSIVKITGKHSDSPGDSNTRHMFVGDVYDEGLGNDPAEENVTVFMMGIPDDIEFGSYPTEPFLALPIFTNWTGSSNDHAEDVFYAEWPASTSTWAKLTNDNGDGTYNATEQEWDESSEEWVDKAGGIVWDASSSDANPIIESSGLTGLVGRVVQTYKLNGDWVFKEGMNYVWEATADASSGTITAKRVNANGSLADPKKTFDVLPS